MSYKSPGPAILTRTDVSTTPYTVTATDQFISVDATGGARTIRLPNSTADGRWFVIKDAGGTAATNNITVTTVGAAINIDASPSYVINTNYGSINVFYNNNLSIYEVW